MTFGAFKCCRNVAYEKMYKNKGCRKMYLNKSKSINKLFSNYYNQRKRIITVNTLILMKWFGQTTPGKTHPSIGFWSWAKLYGIVVGYMLWDKLESQLNHSH